MERLSGRVWWVALVWAVLCGLSACGGGDSEPDPEEPTTPNPPINCKLMPKYCV